MERKREDPGIEAVHEIIKEISLVNTCRRSVANLSGFLGVYNLCYLAKLKSRVTLYGNARE